MLYYLQRGRGPVRLWLHCFLSDGMNLAGLALNTPGTDLYLDMRNHGKSFDSPYISYDLMADDAIKVIDSLKVSKVTAIGHSMGGKTAYVAAMKRPDLFERLVFIDVCPIDYPKFGFDVKKELLRPVTSI